MGDAKVTDTVAVVGTGLVGRAWSMVFARAGLRVKMFDPVAGAAEQALARIEDSLPELQSAALLSGQSASEVRSRLGICTTLEETLRDICHVQESAPERVEVKRELYARMDTLADPEVVLASSTSGIPASDFTAELRHRHRCLVAHPINPPHIIPLVELVPAPWTDPDSVERTHALLLRVGQRPIRLHHEVKGFVVNRLQGALLSEAFRLVEDGVCSSADLDSAIADGLGLRWSFMGPFETIDLNSASGIKGYCEMLGDLYYELAREQADPRRWSAALVEALDQQRRAALPLAALQERSQWRDKRLARLVVDKQRADDDLGT
ncbi:MAG: 3-hydroxyacyl-CoA dehydrogenase [Gammaproteobacteria bacterium]|nr:3-hydroxyacyl-CoA dehydrogenase [Gammaproteobacteria bacterium]